MKKLFAFLFVAIFITGLFFRFILLNISFEYDELFTAVSSNPFIPLSYIWNHYLLVDVHPPLHNVLLWVYNHFVPYGPEWVLRLPSLILGLVTLWEGWYLFPRYLGRTSKWIFTALLSCNFYLILYAQCARSYALIVCAAIPFTFLYLKLARCVLKNRPIAVKNFVWYGLLALVLCWSHYFGALLFGLFSSVLFVLACYRKRDVGPFLFTPIIVLAAFLPWMVPNLVENLIQQRFSGNWWGNRALSWELVTLWIEFFFTAKGAFACLIALAVVRVISACVGPFKHKKWAYKRELILLFIPMAAAGIFVLLISFKIYWLLWRYFMAFLPSLYLFVCLFIAPLCRKYKLALLGVILFAGLSFYSVGQMSYALRLGGIFHARSVMELFKGAFPDKELFVVAVEAFPKESMAPMYGFYLHHLWGMDTRVTEVFQLEEKDFEDLVSRQKEGVFWMPNCSPAKMDQIVAKWNHNVAIFARYENTCFLLFAGEDKRTIDPDLLEDYQHRFSDYAKQLLVAKEGLTVN